MNTTARYFPALMLAVGVAIAAPACAAQTYGYGYPGRGGYGRELERRAYENGYREGIEEGQNDARRGRDFSYERHDEYRDADAGFRRSDGDINGYRRSFRQGFQAGYNEAYDRSGRRGGYGRTYPRGNGRYDYPEPYPNGGDPNGGYGSNRGGYGYGSPAAEAGYRDGLEAGRDDASDRERFDPIRAKRYREGDHGYDRRYGSRDDYKRDYRAAFEHGYREGYGRGAIR
jgi:hypothetical protein